MNCRGCDWKVKREQIQSKCSTVRAIIKSVRHEKAGVIFLGERDAMQKRWHNVRGEMVRKTRRGVDASVLLNRVSRRLDGCLGGNETMRREKKFAATATYRGPKK